MTFRKGRTMTHYDALWQPETFIIVTADMFKDKMTLTSLCLAQESATAGVAAQTCRKSAQLLEKISFIINEFKLNTIF